MKSIEELFNNCGKTVERIRVSYKSSGVFFYLPHSLVKRLGLQKTHDEYFIAVFDDGLLLLFSDNKLQAILKPYILNARQRYEEIRKMTE